MARKEKTVLEMANGVKVSNNLEELRNNFDTEALLKYFYNGYLLQWLEERYYEDEADKVRDIDPDDSRLINLICNALDIPYNDDALDMDAESMERLNEKIAILRQQTDDESIIANANKTAFNQADLADLLDMGSTTIYLCGKEFSIPLRVTGMVYEGILGKPKIKIKANSQSDVDAQQIIFRNVELPWGSVDEGNTDSDNAKYDYENLLKNTAVPVDELIELFNDAFERENNNSDEIWEYVDSFGQYDDKDFSDSKKKMILRLICKNKFNENEVAHACINVDMSAGFVFTTSAVCLYDKEGFYCLNQKARCTNLIIPYANIQEFTEANFTLTLKDGNSFSIEVPKDQREASSAESKDDEDRNGNDGLPQEIAFGLALLEAFAGGSRKIDGCWRLKNGISNYLHAVIDLG